MPPTLRTTADAPVISIRDLVVSYNGRRVPKAGPNSDIFHGETMVLLGGSGSGKTTPCGRSSALQQPQSGQVLVMGVDLAKTTPGELNKLPAIDWCRSVSGRGAV